MTCNNPRADFNHDGVVDNDDFVAFAGAMGTKPGDPNWIPDADFNQDGVIDDADFAIFKANYGCTFDAARRPPCGNYGDIDGDGSVTLKDAEYLAKYVAGISGYTLTEDQKRRANVTGDGKITAVNAMLIAKYANHVYDSFPVCGAAPKPECTEGDKKPGHVCVAGKWQAVPVAPTPGEPVPGPVTPAAKRLTYEESLELVNAGLPVYIKFDIPILDQMPGIQWGPGIPILPGFMMTREP